MFNSLFLLDLLTFIGKIIAEILYFPIWWYSFGFVGAITWMGKFLSNREKNLSLLIWVKNIFKPMFQDYSFSGRIISFFIRLFQIIFRFIIFIFWFIISLVFIFLWLFLPIMAVWQIKFQLGM